MKNKIKKKHSGRNKQKSKKHRNDEGFDEFDGEEDEAVFEKEEPIKKWYDEFDYKKLTRIELSDEEVRNLRAEAQMVLEDEIKTYKTHLHSSKQSDALWMTKVVKSGTSTDKVAALTLMVQESPVHNVSALSSLINMAKVSKKSQFILVIDTLVELFITDLLRPEKKLKMFHKQQLGHLAELCKGDAKLRRKYLCYWLFEDQLKSLYAQFVTSLNEAAHDSVQNNREKAVSVMSKMLLGSLEQEDALLANLINKLGDPVHKVASRVVYSLERVLHKYPSMKQRMLNEVEKMLFRPHIGKRAQYYGICFLSQFRYASGDSQLASDIIVLYFSFFKACVKTGTIDSRLMGALLVGVNRAYPFASKKGTDSVIPQDHIDTMYKVVHLAPFKISLQALALLLQISNSDRFYNALYKKLLDKELFSTSHQGVWLHLVFKALMKDPNLDRVKSFVKRILQVCQYFPVPLACATLFMISQLTSKHPDVFEKDIFLKEDPPVEVKLEVKPESDDEEERYFDAKLENDDTNDSTVEESKPKAGSSWLHRTLVMPKFEPKEPVPVQKVFKPRTEYDHTHRNPAYAGGEHAVFAELLTLSRHFHPSVSLFARTLMNKQKIRYNGDPLRDFTLIRFLERFAYKNPKRQRQGETDKQELFRSVGSERKHYVPKGMRAIPVQSDHYLNQTESAIPVDELFLYKYLKDKRLNKTEKKEKKEDSDDESDVESVGSVEFNDYLDSLTGEKVGKELNFAQDVTHTKESNRGKKKTEDEMSDMEGDDEDEMEDYDESGMEEDEEEEDGESVDEESEGSEEDDEENDDIDEEDNYDEDETPFSDYGDTDNEVALEDALEGSEFEEEEDDRKLPLQLALKRKIGKEFGNMAIPAEKFSELLEEAGKQKSGGAHDLSNRDNAGEKQLKWEKSRMKQTWKTGNKRKQYTDKNSNKKKGKKFRR